MTMEPTPEQFDKWVARASAHAFAIDEASPTYLVYEKLAKLAYQAGADAELEACCEWADSYWETGSDLRSVRRPKPDSLKQEAQWGADGECRV